MRTQTTLTVGLFVLIFLPPVALLAKGPSLPATSSQGENRQLVLVDAGHHNVHSPGKRYRVLAELLVEDGYRVETGSEPWTAERLEQVDLLLVPAPRGATKEESMAARSRSAFALGEIEAVYDWVLAGGALLLISDHPPIGDAADALAKRFGVEGSLAFTEDSERGSEHGELIVFDRAYGGLGAHPLVDGVDGSLSLLPVDRVATYLGQSLVFTPAALDEWRQRVPILLLSESASDRSRLLVDGTWIAPSADDERRSAAGRSQAVALEVGEGRVVVLGEAGMLLNHVLAADAKTPNGEPLDNRQFARNVVGWLME